MSEPSTHERHPYTQAEAVSLRRAVGALRDECGRLRRELLREERKSKELSEMITELYKRIDELEAAVDFHRNQPLWRIVWRRLRHDR
jgi:predicted nuclease with TOPRIM domain